MLNEAIKRELRSIQTHFPGLRRAKFGAYNLATRHLGWRIEDEFRLLSALPAGGLAIDVGANWGQSIYALKRCAKPDRIVSFEPNPALASQLKSEFARDFDVQIEPVGLGADAGEFTLHVPAYRGFEYDGLASLDRTEAVGWLSARRVSRFDPTLLEIHSHKVPVRMLDEYALNPAIIKIDVQGLEEEVVIGGSATIENSKPVMIIEAPSETLVDRLSELGLFCFSLHNGRLRKDFRSNRNCIFFPYSHFDRLNQLIDE